MERALKWYDAPPTFGHQHNETEQSFVQVPDSMRPQETLFANEENVVDLYDYSLENEDHILSSGLTCEASWLALEGNPLDDRGELKSDFSLSQSLLQYYSALIGSLLSDSSPAEIRTTLLNDVKSNSKISPLIPLIVTFIGNGMQRHSDNPVLVLRLLALIDALFTNPYLNLTPKPYVRNLALFKIRQINTRYFQLSHLVSALLSSLISKESEDKPNRTTDHVQYASHILKMALDKWATSVNQLRLQTYKALRECLNDPKRSVSSQYGALTAFNILGAEVIIDCVLPQLDTYLTSLELRKGEKNLPTCNGHVPAMRKQKSEEVHLLWGTFLSTARILLKSQALTKKANAQEIYCMLHKHFGDALLTTNLPKVNQEETSSSAVFSGRLRIRSLPGSGGSHRAPPSSSGLNYPNELNDIFDDPFASSNGGDGQQNGFMPVTISSSVQNHFECRKSTTIVVQPTINFNVRSLSAWPEQRLKRKRLEHTTATAGKTNGKVFAGAVGKRHLLGSDQRQRKKLLSCPLSYVL